MNFYNFKIKQIDSVLKFTPTNTRFSAVNRSNHIIGIQLTGCAKHYFKDRVITFDAGGLYFLNQIENYDVDVIKKGQAFSVHFTTYEPIEDKSFFITSKNNTEIIKLFSIMQQRFLSSSNEHLLTAEFYKLCNLYCATIQKHYKPSDKRLYKAGEYIINHYKDKNCLDKAADLCSISRRRFNDIFKNTFDITPNHFLINHKIDIAKKLLKVKELGIADVAENAGFSDLYYFSRKFKSEIGMTPTEYKSKLIE